MGRAERRRQERSVRIGNKKGKIALRPDQIRKIKRDTADTVARYDVDALMTCFAQVLHTEYGWGSTRVLRALNAVDDMFGKVLNDGLSIDDMKRQLEDELGIRVQSE